MKKIFQIAIAACSLMIAGSAFAQTAIDFNKNDCNGAPAHLYADLDAGKAVVLFYYMPSCGSCPPPAQKIQAMANRINATHPGMVKAYAFPYNNTTTCAYSQSWVTSNSLSLYAPMDSGAADVAAYGGFGMPTVVLVGGANHRVMFTTLSFSNSDTTIMRDSILGLISAPSGIKSISGVTTDVSVYPNPASGNINVEFDLLASGALSITVADITGRQVAVIAEGYANAGVVKHTFNTSALANGIYTMSVSVGGATVNRKFNVLH